MSAVSWQGRLNAASTEAEVVGIARDFIAQFNHQEISSLREECRPRKFVDADDVTNYAFTLVNHVTGGDSPSALLVEKLAAFFSHSSIRIARLLQSANEDRDDSRRST